MKMIFLRPNFVVMLLSVQVHEIQLVYEPQPLQQLDRSVDGRAINS